MGADSGSGVVDVEPGRVELADGRGVVLWRTGPERPATPGRVAIVAPGFARRMRSMAAVARILVDNGFVVYRCDYVDHVGLSDGDIWQFTIGGMYDSLAAVQRHVLEREGVDEVLLVASSLAARACFRLATEPGVVGIVGIVGVVNTRYAMARAFGVDYGARPMSDFDDEEYAEFEGKHIQCRHYGDDWHRNNWIAVEDCESDVADAHCPIVNFCGSSDDWIDIAEMKQVLSRGDGVRDIVELPFVEHELSRNPVAAQTILREVTRYALRFTGAETEDVVETSFRHLAAQIPYERRVENAAG